MVKKRKPQKPKDPNRVERRGGDQGGRKPLTVINWDEFEKLCGIQSTLLEICSWFDCDDVTLSKYVLEHYGMPFSEVFKRKRGKGKVSLRRRQFQAALDGEVSMLIFLGKQYLGQTDKKEIKGMWQNPYLHMTDEELLRETERLKGLESSVDTKALAPVREVIDVGPKPQRVGESESA